jgi:hypothetical protein
MVLISKDRSGKAKAVATKIAAWGRVSGLFQENRMDPLKTKAPTEKRFYDGAAIATFKITFKDETYKSQVLIMVSSKKY